MISSFLTLIFMFCLFFTNGVQATLVASAEDEFCSPASEKVVQVAEKAANMMGFSQEYLLYFCKKRAIQTNPGNKFITLGVHPQTKQYFIMLNQEWFEKLNEDEQLFILARHFAFFTHGLSPWSIKAVECIPWALQAMVIPVYYGLNKTPLADSHVLIKMLASQVIVMLADGLMRKPYCWLFTKMQLGHEIMVSNVVIERTGNKLAARSALKYMDYSINQELAAGDEHWLGFETRYAQLADAVA